MPHVEHQFALGHVESDSQWLHASSWNEKPDWNLIVWLQYYRSR